MKAYPYAFAFAWLKFEGGKWRVAKVIPTVCPSGSNDFEVQNRPEGKRLQIHFPYIFAPTIAAGQFTNPRKLLGI